MQFEFSNINTQYQQTNATVIESISKENADSAKSNISSIYDSSDLNLNSVVVSISSNGNARINAMLNKSIQLRANTANPRLTAADRQQVSKELNKIRREIEEIKSEEDANQMVADSVNNILKYPSESLQTQGANRDHVLQLLSA